MNSYNTRAFTFFLQSIHSLKKESGGQRWNEICKDAAALFDTQFPPTLGPHPFSETQLWQLFFDPPQDTSNPLYQPFQQLCENDTFVTFFFTVLQALLDPPSVWWQAQFR